MRQYNFNSNFNDFRKKLNLSHQDERRLLEARKVIRASIRTAFNEMPNRYFDMDSVNVLRQFMQSSDRVKPKFLTQGSFQYHTINLPANPPIQQMDLDDGVYLPLSYVENEANDNFQQAAKIVRGVIKSCVSDVCAENNWTLNTHSKCLRIVINTTSHIDLPIYSMPDNQLEMIQDSVMFQQNEFLDWDKATNVLLATDGGWVESDPREIQEWVKNEKSRFGNDFINYTRYLKAWKDYQWDESGFSSIMIMAGVAQAMSEAGYSKNDNVALNLSKIATSLKLYLSASGVKHPVKTERMNVNSPEKNQVISLLGVLADNLSKAVRENDTQLLVASFGVRFPNNSGVAHNIGATSSAAIITSTPIQPHRKQCF